MAVAESSSLILIVDDEPSGRQALEALLLGQGYELTYASNGPSALDICRRLEPDLILLDVMMPGMDGIESLRRIRSESRLAEIPVLLVSALDDRSSKIAGLEAGADGFIAKPFDRAELRARIRTIIRLNRYRKLQDALTSLESAYDATLAGWMRVLDLREHELEGHSQRVAGMAVRLASSMGIDGQDLVHLGRGALLHDIGKIAIPDAILSKPGPLDAHDWAIMRKHPEYGRLMLEPIEYLRSAIDIPYCHHERWDGRGYPLGLANTRIPRAARIFSAVDVWDALITDRPYRSAWSSVQVAQYLAENSGTLFDPEVTSAFLELLKTSPEKQRSAICYDHQILSF